MEVVMLSSTIKGNELARRPGEVKTSVAFDSLEEADKKPGMELEGDQRRKKCVWSDLKQMSGKEKRSEEGTNSQENCLNWMSILSSHAKRS